MTAGTVGRKGEPEKDRNNGKAEWDRLKMKCRTGLPGQAEDGIQNSTARTGL
jgi:hypothetical protein